MKKKEEVERVIIEMKENNEEIHREETEKLKGGESVRKRLRKKLQNK